jgi:hypothetical protein
MTVFLKNDRFCTIFFNCNMSFIPSLLYFLRQKVTHGVHHYQASLSKSRTRQFSNQSGGNFVFFSAKK